MYINLSIGNLARSLPRVILAQMQKAVRTMKIIYGHNGGRNKKFGNNNKWKKDVSVERAANNNAQKNNNNNKYTDILIYWLNVLYAALRA